MQDERPPFGSMFPFLARLDCSFTLRHHKFEVERLAPDSISLNSPITSKCQTKVLPIVCCPLHNTVTLNKYKDFNSLPDELLLAACKNDQDDMLDDIFKEGSYDINFRDGAGNTAAHYA
jgi:hypothetical protein